MSILQRRALSLLLIMALAALLAWSVRPTVRLADQGAALDLETLVPHQFAGWELDERQSAAVVNPQAGDRISVRLRRQCGLKQTSTTTSERVNG